MGLGTQLAEETGGSSVDKLRKRQDELKGGGAKPSVAKKRSKAEAKSNGKSKNGKAEKPAKAKAKAEKPAKAKAKKETTRRTARPEGEKSEGRTLDRDRKGDGLRDVERSIIKIVEKANGGISVLNLAGKLFKKDPTEVPSEGKDSIRVVRNNIRRPITMGLLEWAGRGTVQVTKSFAKDGMKVAERFMDKARKAQEAEREERKAAKPKKTKKVEKAAKSKKAEKTGKSSKNGKAAKPAKKGGKAKSKKS